MRGAASWKQHLFLKCAEFIILPLLMSWFLLVGVFCFCFFEKNGVWYTNAIRGRICGIDQAPLTFASLYMDQKVLFAEGGR